MLERTLSEEYRTCYQNSRHRERIAMLAGRLGDLRYSKIAISRHLREWLRFACYCEKRAMDMPGSIYAPEVHAYLRHRFLKGSKSALGLIRASVRIFIEADEQGQFAKRRPAPPPTNALFRSWIPSYIDFLKEHRGVSAGTVRKNMLALDEFTKFVEGLGIHDLRSLEATHVHDFCTRRGTRKPVTWATSVGIVRRFLRHVFTHQGTEQDLSLAAPGFRCYRYSGLYDVLTDQEVEKLLESFDHSDAIGRRDYAMLLLAARYGMRPCDIRTLTLDDIHWREEHITVCQSKTGMPLALPLLSDVAEALIAYLQDGRPTTQVRNVFISHIAPFQPFGPHNNLFAVMAKALARAGLGERSGARGLYLFRHTLAARMQEIDIALKTIGDVLGHASTASTPMYAKVNLPALRSASLSIEEVLG